MRWIPLFSLVIMWPIVCLATIIHVPADQLTIQAGINASVDGDTVLVAPNTYFENINLGGRNILLTSEGGRDATFIRPDNPNAIILMVVNGENTNCVIDGFTFSNTSNAWGIYCADSDPIIRNCDISYCNYIGDGAGIVCDNSAARIEYCLIHNNGSSVTGGGILFHGSSNNLLEVSFNKLYNNISASGSGIASTNSSGAIISRNAIWRNTSSGDAGGAIYVRQNVIIENNTIVDNAMGVTILGGANVDIRNNIIVSNSSEGLVVGNATFDYNDVWNNGSSNNGGFHGFSQDPQFVQQEENDYSLLITSPCINTGDPDVQYNDPDGTRNDMGAYYTLFGLPFPTNMSFGDEQMLNIVSHTPSIYWSYYDTSPSTQFSYEIEVGTDDDWESAEMWDDDPVLTTDTSVIYNGNPLIDGETYYIRLRLANGSGWGEWWKKPFRMNSVPPFPNLFIPDNEGVIYANPPTLTVQTSDAEGDDLLYTVQIAVDSTFFFPMIVMGVGESDNLSEIDVDSMLGEDQRYWWRVKTSDYFEETGFCEPHSFYVDGYNVAPSPFNLILPGNIAGGKVFTQTPELIWSLSTNPDPLDIISYTLYVAIDSGFVFTIPTYDIADTVHTLSYDLQWDTEYWWKVKAEDLADGLTWSSEVFRFHAKEWLCGDCDASLSVDIDDVVYLINYVFSGGPAPVPVESGDADCSSEIDIDDIVFLIEYIFASGQEPCADC